MGRNAPGELWWKIPRKTDCRFVAPFQRGHRPNKSCLSDNNKKPCWETKKRCQPSLSSTNESYWKDAQNPPWGDQLWSHEGMLFAISDEITSCGIVVYWNSPNCLY